MKIPELNYTNFDQFLQEIRRIIGLQSRDILEKQILNTIKKINNDIN